MHDPVNDERNIEKHPCEPRHHGDTGGIVLDVDLQELRRGHDRPDDSCECRETVNEPHGKQRMRERLKPSLTRMDVMEDAHREIIA